MKSKGGCLEGGWGVKPGCAPVHSLKSKLGDDAFWHQRHLIVENKSVAVKMSDHCTGTASGIAGVMRPSHSASCIRCHLTRHLTPKASTGAAQWETVYLWIWFSVPHHTLHLSHQFISMNMNTNMSVLGKVWWLKGLWNSSCFLIFALFMVPNAQSVVVNKNNDKRWSLK